MHNDLNGLPIINTLDKVTDTDVAQLLQIGMCYIKKPQELALEIGELRRKGLTFFNRPSEQKKKRAWV